VSALSISFVFRSYNPVSLRPGTERGVTAVLGVLASLIWLLVLPLELALAS